MPENEKQELILHFKKFYNALSLISKQRLKAIADKELNTVSQANTEQSLINSFRKLSADRE